MGAPAQRASEVDVAVVDQQSDQHFINQKLGGSGPAVSGFLDIRDAARHPREGMSPWRWPVIRFFMMLAMFLTGYDISNIANLQPSIYETFGNVDLLPWAVLGYTAAMLSMSILVSKLVAFMPLKELFLAAQCVVAVGAAVAGSATSMNSLIVGRIISGMGSAYVIGIGNLYAYEFSTAPEFARLQGLWGLSWAVGLIAGPIIGAAFSQNPHATWRWAIYINIPVLAVTSFLTIVSLPKLRLDANGSILNRLAAVDWTGAVLHIAVTILFCCALIFSGSTWAWDSASVIIIWVVLGLASVAYVVQQAIPVLTTAERRHFLVSLFAQHRSVLLVVISTSGSGMAYAITLYYTPLFLAFSRGLTPIQAAVRLLPFIGTFIASTVLSNGLLPRLRYYPLFYIASGVLIMVGAGVQTTTGLDTSTGRLMGLDALIGFGVGLTFQLGAGILPRLVSHGSHSARTQTLRREATAAHLFGQYLGIVIALPVAACIFQNVGFSLLESAVGGFDLFKKDDLRQALAGVNSKLFDVTQPQADVIIPLTVAAVTTVIIRLYWLVLGGGALSLIGGLCMKWEALDFGSKSDDS